MWLGCEEALHAYVEALTGELDRLATRLARRPTHGLARALRSVQNALHAERPAASRHRIQALHRLAMVAEDQGWLDPGEVLVVRKLAYRIAFYLRRQTVPRERGPVHPPDLRY
jgi:hypothetical protein